MKKSFLLFSLFSFIFSLGITFGYSTEDLSNANSLADKEIIMTQTIASKYNLDNKILRQEVIGMALKVKGITLPENYTCKKYFADATKNDWVCRAVELAADNGIITRSNKYANPGKSVTRAEALAMVMKAGGSTTTVYSGGPYPFTDVDKNSWQYDLIGSALKTGVVSESNCDTSQNARACAGISYGTFYPNREATRAEVFGFVNKLLGGGQGSILNIGGHTIEVIDGDTIHFDTLKIRMIGLDTPEVSKSRFGYVECFGLEAKNHLIDLLKNKKEIILEKDATQGELDMYGRTLAYIVADGININIQMIYDGYGFEETFKKAYKYQKEHKDAQASADKGNLGLWSESTCGGDRKKGTIDEKGINQDIPTTNGSSGNNNTGTNTCGTKLYCTQMTTCEEATYYLNKCGLTRLDSDGDGLPCESLCIK